MSFIFSPPIAIGQQRQQPQRQQQQHQLTTEAWRPANGDFMLSKSLGDTFDFGRRSVNATNSRHNRSNLTDDQDSSKIMYSGYLLKRSNHSYPASSYPDLLNTRVTANSDHVINTSLLQKEQDTATGTQNNVDDSDDDNDDDDEVLNNHPRTTTANFLQPVYHAVPPPPPPDNTRVHHSANLMASFFGMTPDIQQLVINGHGYSKRETGTHATDTPVRLLPPPTIQRSPRAVPIAISPTKQPLSQQLQQPVSSQQNQPPTSQVPPPDNVIDKDGHVWRAKYCVLQHGILYFYKNEIDATSRDATLERLLMSSNSRSDGDDEPDDLSKSPLPRGGGGGWKGHYPLNGSIRDTTTTTTIKEVIWEKRVALDGVGAVRSADVEYGPCSFELSAIPDNENVTDKLVLRARNAQEMNEWLFQFHRSIASFMKTIMDAMDLAPAAPMLIRKMSSTLSTSLSHGHGRSGRHRKRISTSDATNGNTKPDITHEIVFPSSPESNGSPVQFALDRMASMPELPTEESLLPPLSLVDLETLRPDNSASISRETERALPVTPARSKTKYIPPHLRAKATETPSRYKTAPEVVVALSALDEPPSTSVPPCVLGGCADPSVAIGSIMDLAYKGRKASTVGKATTKAFGCFGGGGRDETALQWEIGAISECGIRESQEDSFLICNDLIQAFQDLPVSNGKDISMWSQSHHKPGVFAIFDGHCGNQASRYAAEKFTQYLYEQSKIQCGDIPCTPQDVVVVLEKAIQKLDDDFCRICVEKGREWESGTTALVVAVVSDHLVIANLGDCRAVMCRSVEMDCLDDKLEQLQSDGWTQDDDDDLGGKWERAIGNDTGRNLSRWCFWKEVADVHDPSREDERERIKAANGWVTTEKEIPISQLQRIDFYDEDVLEILRRCFADRLQEHQQVSASRKACNAAPQRILLISRVCGELAVSRAVGDRDFKAAFNHSISDSAGGDETSVWWECPLFLPYLDDTHSGKFKGDLVSSMPEIQTVQLSQKDVVDEFVLLACDGLWDVMDPDDAIRVTTGLLFEKKWTAKKAAARLAELAIHLGSSDNVTVIVIRFFTNT